MKGINDKWDMRFLELAKTVSEWSKDPSTKVGAVIVRPDKTIASIGYNGFPKQISDNPVLLQERGEKYLRIIHGEMNALIHCRESIEGYSLYTWPFAPCSNCASMFVQTGISRVVYPRLPEELCERWGRSLIISESIFSEAGVQFIKHS